MTLNRRIFSKIQRNAESYCRFDDYNWDWSLVNMQSHHVIPYAILMPSQHLVKHIGLQGGMHFNKAKRIEVSTNFTGLHFAGSLNPLPNRIRRAYGGWGHPIDQNHCMDVLHPTSKAVIQNE
jgi:N-acetylglucosaminyltransferase II (MGAT2)